MGIGKISERCKKEGSKIRSENFSSQTPSWSSQIPFSREVNVKKNVFIRSFNNYFPGNVLGSGDLKRVIKASWSALSRKEQTKLKQNQKVSSKARVIRLFYFKHKISHRRETLHLERSEGRKRDFQCFGK